MQITKRVASLESALFHVRELTWIMNHKILGSNLTSAKFSLQLHIYAYLSAIKLQLNQVEQIGQ